MSGPERLSFTMPEGFVPGQRSKHCGGALLRVDRNEYDNYARSGLRWSQGRAEVFRAGDVGHARVECHDDVEERGGVTYGLCRSCSELEARHRAAIAAGGK